MDAGGHRVTSCLGVVDGLAVEGPMLRADGVPAWRA